jgi:hypothetical protein
VSRKKAMNRKTSADPHITDEVETNSFFADSFERFTVFIDRVQMRM